MKCRSKTSKLLKYSSLWFALKATQNSKLLRNDDFIDSEENEYLFNNNNDYIEINDSNCDLNGCVAETELMEQMSSHNESCVQLNKKFSRNSVNDVMNNTRLKAIDLIEIDTKRTLVLINRKDSNYELTFGCLRMTSLTDNFHICVNGFTLMPNKTIELFAVFGYKLLINCQINELSHNQDFNEDENRLKSLELESKQIESLMNQINDKKSGIILIEKLCLSSLLYLENFENFKPLNMRSDSVWFELQNTGSHRFLKTDIWDTLFVELNLSKNDIIIVSGGKDVGKSSLIRYLVNKYLSQNSTNSNEIEILYLDCDPGQSEFTTSGLLSLTLIDRPVLGPSSINAINFKPLMSSSIGVISVNRNPKLYISCISYIMDYISNNLQSKGPLFINTMGWTRDLGLALLLDIIRITSPTHVIQIDSAIDPKKNFAVDLTSNSVLKYEGFKFGPFDGIQRLDYKLTVIESLLFKTNSTQAKTNRLLTQLSYISQMRDIIFKPISAMTPFKYCLNY
jgi:hypothetical protein